MSHLKTLLRYTSKLLINHNARNWIDYATCLGSYRHDHIIPWDYDVDFAVRSEDAQAIVRLCKDIQNDGYHVFYRNHGDPKSTMREGPEVSSDVEVVKIFLHPGNLLHADMYVFKESDSGIRRVCDTLPGPKVITHDLVSEVELVDFHGCQVQRPTKITDYLSLIYGENFMDIPQHRMNDFERWKRRVNDQS